MSQQLTVKKLSAWLNKLVKEGHGDKFIIISDDTEGNNYHGMFFTPTYDEQTVRECIECSNGIYETNEENPANLVILG